MLNIVDNILGANRILRDTYLTILDPFPPCVILLECPLIICGYYIFELLSKSLMFRYELLCFFRPFWPFWPVFTNLFRFADQKWDELDHKTTLIRTFWVSFDKILPHLVKIYKFLYQKKYLRINLIYGPRTGLWESLL